MDTVPEERRKHLATIVCSAQILNCLVRDFLNDSNLTDDQVERIVYLVCHHHTYTNVDGLVYRILLEADYLVNADESDFSRANIHKAFEDVFKTKSGKELLKSIFAESLEE